MDDQNGKSSEDIFMYVALEKGEVAAICALGQVKAEINPQNTGCQIGLHGRSNQFEYLSM